MSLRIRKRIVEAFGWIKTVVGKRKTRFNVLERVLLAPLPRCRLVVVLLPKRLHGLKLAPFKSWKRGRSMVGGRVVDVEISAAVRPPRLDEKPAEPWNNWSWKCLLQRLRQSRCDRLLAARVELCRGKTAVRLQTAVPPSKHRSRKLPCPHRCAFRRRPVGSQACGHVRPSGPVLRPR